jgi:hypothetical protein
MTERWKKRLRLRLLFLLLPALPRLPRVWSAGLGPWSGTHAVPAVGPFELLQGWRLKCFETASLPLLQPGNSAVLRTGRRERIYSREKKNTILVSSMVILALSMGDESNG